MKILRRLSLLLLPFVAVACNAETVSADKPAAQVQIDKSVFEKRFAKLGLDVMDVVPSDIDGLVEVQTAGGVLFASPDGKHFIAGTLYEMDANGGYTDVLAKRQAPINAKKIAQFQKSMIEYKADNEKYVVTVFTDITCGYCVRLHSQMKEYNDAGITVRYLAYPRQGPTGQVAEQMAAIWCSEDPKTAIHNAKMNRQMLETKGDLAQCKQTIAQHYQLGRELGISGTPAIFLPNGEMVGGYLPAAQLLQRLQQM
ncbi:bifunctional protein-disulfide isomerase/oxidoreductase DsbC [Vibrio fluvialis]|nr:bifunctional protein-disulfide isomerase/oxidoreductase DsbC [Vibrio fluvialis]EKO3460418.1 bifunctional protein-disulfide isomerase/oxidoreductase DsbC [Vibrio fluvialis]EMA2481944.1 bifunctional protein-disulfide isomerase/oxidoreductase DsbC [Vibrio fluvialis]